MIRRSAIAALAAAFVSPPLSARAVDAAPLRVSVTPIDAGSQCYYAVDQGFFDKNGLSVSLQTILNSSAAIEALVSGAIDIGYANITNFEEAFKKGIPVIAVAAGGYYDQANGRNASVMVRNGVTIDGPKDFNGHVIASPGLRSLPELATDAWIDAAGGDSSKVKYIEVPFPLIAAALQSGRVDGAVLVEPFASAAKTSAHVIGTDPFSAIGPRWLGGVWVASKSWAAAHPELVRRFAVAMRAAGEWANANPDKSAPILAKYTSMPLPMINAAPRVVFASDLQAAMIQPTINLVAHYGLIEAPFKADDLIYRAAR